MQRDPLWYFSYPPCTLLGSPFCTSRSRTLVLKPAALRICIALSQESARRRITATPLHILGAFEHLDQRTSPHAGERKTHISYTGIPLYVAWVGKRP